MAVDDDSFLEEEEEEGKEEEKKGLSDIWAKMLMYGAISLGVIVLSALTSLAVYYLKPFDKQKIYSPDQLKKVAKPRSVYTIPEFKTPLDKKEDESVQTFVQVKLQLAYEHEKQEVFNEIVKRKEQIRDKIQFIIAKKNYEEIKTAQNREDKLKNDLKYALNNILSKGQILDIYFETFVISRVPG